MNFYNNNICYCRRCQGIIYIIQPGDTLYKIGKKYGVTAENIMSANPFVNAYNLQVGQRICIPTIRQEPQPRRMESMQNEKSEIQKEEAEQTKQEEEIINKMEEFVDCIEEKEKIAPPDEWKNKNLPEGFYDGI